MYRTTKHILALAVICLMPLSLYASNGLGSRKGINEQKGMTNQSTQRTELSESVQVADSTAATDEQKAENYLVDEVVAVVGNITILYSDIERTAQYVDEIRKQRGSLSVNTPKEEALAMLLRQSFLATCAQLDSLDQNMQPYDDMVEEQVALMAQKAGGVRELEAVSGKPIYQIKSDMNVEIKQQQLAKMMEQNVRQKVRIDYAEVAEFADTLPKNASRMIPLQYSYSQIVRQPAETEQRKYAIRETLLGYRQRILDKEVTLGVLAQLYSMDYGSARRRGEMGPQPITELVGPFVETLQQMKPGDISEIVETEYGYHLIELISITDDQVPQVHFRHILLKPEFTVEESKQVVAQLDSIATEIKIGTISFADAALLYSDDVETKQNGGRAFNTLGYSSTYDIRATSSRFVEEELMPADYRQIAKLKIGEISDPFETVDLKGNVIRKIVKLDGILEAHSANVVDDYDLLSATAEQVKQSRVVEDWISENIPRVYIQIKPEYWDYNLGRDEWVEAAKRTVEFENLGVKYPTTEEIESAMEEYKFLRAQRALQERAAQDAADSKKSKKKK